MGSADWMKRNLRNRVEVIFPILDPAIKDEVLKFLDIQFAPAIKTQLLSTKLQPLNWSKQPKQYCAQHTFYLYLRQKAK